VGGGGEEREWGGRGESTLDLARHGRGGAELIGETKVKATRLAVFEMVGIPIHL